MDKRGGDAAGHRHLQALPQQVLQGTVDNLLIVMGRLLTIGQSNLWESLIAKKKIGKKQDNEINQPKIVQLNKIVPIVFIKGYKIPSAVEPEDLEELKCSLLLSPEARNFIGNKHIHTRLKHGDAFCSYSRIF